MQDSESGKTRAQHYCHIIVDTRPEHGGHTACPRGLSACIPILAVEAESEQIPLDVEDKARQCMHCDGRKEEKSDEGGQ